MKSIIRILLAIAIIGFASGNQAELIAGDTTLSAIEEMKLAFKTINQARKIESEGKKEKSLEIYNQAYYHYANIVVRDDANDTLRAEALYKLHWIESYQKHNYGMALQYLEQCIAVNPNSDQSIYALL